MIKEEIAPGIVVYSDVISDSQELHNDIEEGITSARLGWADAGVKEGQYSDQVVNLNTRNTKTIGIPYLGEIVDLDNVNMQDLFFKNLNNLFFESFDLIEKDYMSSYGIFSEWHDSYGILKYGEGQQFTNHIDDHPSFHRRVSTVYYLNDNYIGGEINFPRFNISLKPKANQMLMFPSTYVYNHSVSPVIQGERYAVVSWLK
jgi:Rps23 Pro-64 3,4-dihydroxylase Tpa1-like proline 4-hydroxylase